MPKTTSQRHIPGVGSQLRGQRRQNRNLTQPAPAPAPPRTDYKNFLLNHIVKKNPSYLANATVKKWQDTPNTDQGKIINEIAKKFNNNNKLGIDEVNYIRGAGQPNYYEGATAGGGTKMTLAPPPYGRVPKGPDPTRVGHELIHANDHQIDQLNPKVWRNLGALATTGGATGGPMANFDEFDTSIKKIQDKIDPTHAFKGDVNVINSGYPINQDYIKHDMEGAQGPGHSYNIPLTQGAPNWTQLFNDINGVVTSTAAPGGVPNQGFYLNRASEFPGFMSERLTVPWSTGRGRGRLTKEEAGVLYDTLGHMYRAYPAGEYPTMNHYINERGKSLERAHGNFSHGGRATRPKSKKYGLSHFMNRELGRC